ncbi:hypothetical protein D3C85_682690 [compost metagenome]
MNTPEPLVMRSVGARALAMDVNDYTYFLSNRVVLEFIASTRASTGCSYKCGFISLDGFRISLRFQGCRGLAR